MWTKIKNKIFPRIRAETQPPETVGLNDRRLLEMLGIEIDKISYRGKNALKEATVFACVRVLADAVGKLPVKVYQEKDDKQGRANHYLAALLKTRPNPWMSARDFKKAMETQRLIHGNAYAWLDIETRGGDAGKVIGIYPLDATQVEIYIDDVGLLPGKGKLWYVYTDNKNTKYRIDPDEMLHFKGLSYDGIIGMTPLTQLQSTIENAGAASQFLNNSYKSGMQTKGIIHYVGDLDTKAEKVFREKFEQMSSGLKNANRVSLLPIGYQFQPLSLTMTDAQFLENTELTIRQIAAAFGVKMHQLNELTRATHSNVEHQQREFYIDTLMDILTGYEQELTYKLFTQRELDDGYYIKFNVNAILRADPKTRYEGYRIAIQSGFLTANEVRALEEMEAKEGGDRLLINGNMMPIEMAGAQYKKGGDNSAQTEE
ncbi:MAG: phage portal protein [Bacteroidales bacterium]|nr:phage portal protein [Bacteroidales bacterium]